MNRFKQNLTLIILILLTSCNQATNQKLKIAYIGKETDQSFHEGILNGIKKQMAKRNIEVDFFSGKNQKDITSQENAILKIAKEKIYDGVMICPNDSEKIISSIKKLDNSQIPYLLIDTPIKENAESKTLKNNCGYVGTDNFLIGKDAFKLISKKMSKGNLLLIRGVESHRSSSDREDGFLNELSKNKNFIIDSFITGDWKIDKSYEEIKSHYSKNRLSKIDAIFAYNDHMAVGAAKYFKELGLKKPYIIGVDGTVVGQKGLLEGEIDGILVQATELMGIKGLDRIIECIGQNKKENLATLTPSTLMEKTSSLERNE